MQIVKNLKKEYNMYAKINEIFRTVSRRIKMVDNVPSGGEKL